MKKKHEIIKRHIIDLFYIYDISEYSKEELIKLRLFDVLKIANYELFGSFPN